MEIKKIKLKIEENLSDEKKKETKINFVSEMKKN